MSQPITINLLYFASVREAAGRGGETLALDGSQPTVATLCDHLKARGGSWAALFDGATPVKFAVNQQFCAADTPLADGCEVALFPPVTGG